LFIFQGSFDQTSGIPWRHWQSAYSEGRHSCFGLLSNE